MTVKEAIEETAELLGLGAVKTYLQGGEDEEGEKAAKALIRCFNVVENELALDYLPLCAEDTLASPTGRVLFSQLTYPAVRVISVKDESGNRVKFRLFPDCIKTQPGRIQVAYTYTPKEKTVKDSSDFVLQTSKRLFSYGMASEYCLAAGLYEEAEIWDKKYKDAVEAAYRVSPSKVLKSRRWE